MKKYVSTLLIIAAVFAVFSPIVADTMQSARLTEVQLNSSVGGQPVMECTAFLLACGGLTGGNPWLVGLCIIAAGACIVV